MSDLNVSVATPERVALDLPVAGIGSRAIAYIIDAGLLFLGGLVLYFLYSLLNSDILKTLEDMSGAARVIGILVIFGLMWIYWTAFEVIWNGQTLGKRIMKIRVVGADGSPVTVLQSSIRNLIRLIDFLPTCYPVGLITMLVDSRHRRLGDIAAGTILIREHAIDLGRYETATSHAAQALSSADLESVTDLLARFDSLNDDSRVRLAKKYAVKLGLAAADADSMDATRLKAYLETRVKDVARG